MARSCASKFYSEVKHEADTHSNSKEIKLQLEKEYDLPGLPAWHKVKWMFGQ